MPIKSRFELISIKSEYIYIYYSILYNIDCQSNQWGHWPSSASNRCTYEPMDFRLGLDAQAWILFQSEQCPTQRLYYMSQTSVFLGAESNSSARRSICNFTNLTSICPRSGKWWFHPHWTIWVSLDHPTISRIEHQKTWNMLKPSK